MIQAGAVRASHFVLIPTRTDDASLDGLDPVAQLGPNSSKATRRAAPRRGGDVCPRQRDGHLGDSPLEDKRADRPGTTFRQLRPVGTGNWRCLPSQGPAGLRIRGRCGRRRKVGKARREGRKTKGFSAAASNLAGDYEALGQEVFARYLDFLKNEPVGELV